MNVKTAALLLAQQTGLRDVAPADVRELAERGRLHVTVAGEWPLVDLPFDVAHLAIPGDWERTCAKGGPTNLPPGLTEELHRIGEERRAWRAASMSRWDAAEELGLSPADFELLATRAGLQPGRFGRYCRTDVVRLRPGVR